MRLSHLSRSSRPIACAATSSTFRAKTTSPSAAAPEKLFPAGLAQLALGFSERMLSGDARAADEFQRMCALIEEKAERRGEELR
jgi:hypothetical protein